jgi:hypothetical protein
VGGVAAVCRGSEHKLVDDAHVDGVWAYTMVVADALPGPDGELFTPRALSESADCRWVPIFMVEHMPEKLHPAFEQSWPALEKRIPMERSPRFPETKQFQGPAPSVRLCGYMWGSDVVEVLGGS